jgi:hypothetical protein
MSSNITQPIVGHNITFNFTLLRTGNGTQWPTYIDIHHTSERNVSYAYDYVSNQDEYNDLIYSDPTGSGPRPHDRAQRMLQIPSLASIETDRKHQEEAEDGTQVFQSIRIRRGVFPMRDGGARYEFWSEDDLVEKGKYEFGLELHM